MKIALITLEYPPNNLGGAGVYAKEISVQIARLGHEMHVMTLGMSSSYLYYMEQGSHIHRIPVGRFSALKTLWFWAILPWAFSHLSRTLGGFDIVHSNGISDLTLGRVASPRVVTVHHLSSSSVKAVRPPLSHRLRHPGSELGLIPYLEWISSQRAQRIVAVSEYTRTDLINTLQLEPTRITVIGHGARPEDYRFSSEDLAEIRAQLGIGTDPFVLFVGRLELRKGITVLLNAFAKVLQRCRAVLVLAGSGQQASYREIATRLVIHHQVIFLGYVSHLMLRKLYAACDLLVFPSLMEGLGIVVLEARAAGKFIVASQVGGVPEVVPAGAGYLVPPGDVAALADALMKALSEPHTELPPVPTWEEAGLQLCKVYEEVVS